MEKETRSAIQRATQAARTLLEAEVGEQLAGTFDIRADGSVAGEPGAHLRGDTEALRARVKLVAAVRHHRDQGRSPVDAVAALTRECAFTTLNRFVALEMLEARGIVLECVSKGPASAGFKEFTGLCPGLSALPDQGYRLYLETVFDEIGREVRVLFDRRDTASLVWPRKPALDALLAILNGPELSGPTGQCQAVRVGADACPCVWCKDETIGWVYQYFNTDADREHARVDAAGKPKPPSNSRELAVRNQFFTPRYVVEFLADNTLARTWVEMRRGDSRLAEDRRYLVQRPGEVFLAEDEEAPEGEAGEERPRCVPYRAKKDPRDLKVLDPACGSGHFLLYSFDLLLAIYEEAWADPSAPRWGETKHTLAEDYPTLAELRRELPRLVLFHNLYGVDIDPRAAQIAALALWMRAQKAWNQFGVKRAERPLVTRTNIVVAEPMPGEADLLDELCRGLDPGVGAIVRDVFEEMKLAGEAGMLLRVEDTVRRGLEKLANLGPMYVEEGSRRWRKIDTQVTSALRAYAEAAGGVGYRKRLFAEDAARGFAFVEVCRQRYDVVLMNPPFGEASDRVTQIMRLVYPGSADNLYCSFLLRSRQVLREGGCVGLICDRSVLSKQAYEDIRRRLADGDPSPLAVVDLGWHVLDANVETAAIVLGAAAESTLFDDAADGGQEPEHALAQIARGRRTSRWFPIARFSNFPYCSFAYNLPSQLHEAFSRHELAVPSHLFEAVRGMVGADAPRLYRLCFEVDPTRVGMDRPWVFLQKGSPFSPYYYPAEQLLLHDEGTYRTVLSSPSGRVTGQTRYGQAGMSYGKRTDHMYAFAMQAGQAFSVEGHAIFPADGTSLWASLAVANSAPYQYLVNCFAGQHKYHGYLNVLHLPRLSLGRAEELAREAWSVLREFDSANELSTVFEEPLSIRGLRHGASPAEAISRAVDFALQINDRCEAIRRAVDLDLSAQLGFPTVPPGGALRVDYAKVLFGVPASRAAEAEHVVSYLVGAAFGRWQAGGAAAPASDQRLAELNRPISPQAPAAASADSGICTLVVDHGHNSDIARRMELAFDSIVGTSWEETREELEGLLGCSIRTYVSQRYFSAHIDRYTRARRSAPVYWQIGTPSGSYSIWLYIHRCGPDTLHAALRDHVEPKLRFELGRLAALQAEGGDTPAPSQRKAIDAQQAFVDELSALRDELARVAPLWNPDLDDGVVINASFLHRLFAHTRSWQKECEAHWTALQAGDYDWAHLAMRLWPERVVPKCAVDRSLAIAHSLEDTFWEEDTDGKWHPKQVSDAEVEGLIRARTSPAVKDALARLGTAPEPTRARAPRASMPRAAAPRAAAPSPAAPAHEPTQLGLGLPSTQADSAALDALREALRRFPDGAGKTELLASTGLDEASWKPAIDTLVANGEIVRTGQARGTKYHLPERP